VLLPEQMGDGGTTKGTTPGAKRERDSAQRRETEAAGADASEEDEDEDEDALDAAELGLGKTRGDAGGRGSAGAEGSFLEEVMEGAAGGQAKAEKLTGKKAQSGRFRQSSSSNRCLLILRAGDASLSLRTFARRIDVFPLFRCRGDHRI
jgi:hypothetical protein